jgi:sugar phosphate permease
VWLAGCLIARSAAPAQLAGIFLTMQNISQFAFAAIIPATVMDRFGANGGFAVLALTGALAMLLIPFIPQQFQELPARRTTPGALTTFTLPAVASLVCVFLIAAFSIGLFVYIAPLATQSHLSNREMGYAVSAVLAASTAGSTLAAVVAKRINYFVVFVVCVAVNVGVLIVFNTLPPFWSFIAASSVFGFFWLFFLPFQLPLVIASDPTRRIAVILPGAQLLGGAAGPFLCSFFVSDDDSRGSIFVCGICFLLSFVIAIGLQLHRRRAQAVVVPPVVVS